MNLFSLVVDSIDCWPPCVAEQHVDHVADAHRVQRHSGVEQQRDGSGGGGSGGRCDVGRHDDHGRHDYHGARGAPLERRRDSPELHVPHDH